jgi:hypothetical protein
MNIISEWKYIVGYEGLYCISSDGRVKSIDRMIVDGRTKEGTRILKGAMRIFGCSKNGYSQIILFKNGGKKIFLVHRLVAEHFIDNPENKKQVNHKDGNKKNNLFENLEWVSASENSIHAYNSKLRIAPWTGKKRSIETKEKISITKRKY